MNNPGMVASVPGGMGRPHGLPWLRVCVWMMLAGTGTGMSGARDEEEMP